MEGRLSSPAGPPLPPGTDPAGGGSGGASRPPRLPRAPGPAAPPDDAPEDEADEAVSLPDGWRYVVSVSRKSGFRRIHRASGCHRVAGTHFKDFRIGRALDEVGHYNDYCKDCWRGGSAPSAADEVPGSSEGEDDGAEELSSTDVEVDNLYVDSSPLQDQHKHPTAALLLSGFSDRRPILEFFDD